jgi:membrane protease YdiL (CAAX protease family)
LGWITLIGFSALGFGILYYAAGLTPLQILFEGQPIWWQITVGLISGAGIGLAALKLLEHPYVQPAAAVYEKLILSFNLRPGDVVFISFCAGFGEEILFRGAVQHYLGIWAAAVIFVAIHGYLNPRNTRIMVYGLFMTLSIGLLGYMREQMGIWTAISGHFTIDVVLLFGVLLRQHNRG